ncbi:MAG TPA: polysaccharide pyruvyl transferase family protein, partial [Longilinea sp.]|nr:polysaccharide pyruvyl transferase family protein [Longilinea sp.]
MKILLLDFCSEKNRGDAAMQVGLIELVYQNFQDPEVSIISVYGANQSKNLQDEFDHSTKYPVTILGGLRPTFYPINGKEQNSTLRFELLQMLNFIPCLLLPLALKLHVPLKLIKRFLPKYYRNTFDQMVSADIVIWKGKNFRSRKNKILEIYRTLVLIYHPLFCSILSKPLGCVGTSVWSLNSPISRFFLKTIFEKCTFISAREEKSYRELVKLMGDKSTSQLDLLPDLSYAAMADRKDSLQKRRRILNTAYPQRVGMTIVDWKDEGTEVRNTYKKSIVALISFLIEKGSEIVLIPQVTKNWESNADLILEMVSNSDIQKHITRVEGQPSVNELLTIYSNLDFLVASRMHSAIFASAVNTPLVAVAYDSGGKWGILESLGYGDYIINYKDITPEKLRERVISCWENREQLLKYAETKIEEN